MIMHFDTDTDVLVLY